MKRKLLIRLLVLSLQLLLFCSIFVAQDNEEPQRFAPDCEALLQLPREERAHLVLPYYCATLDDGDPIPNGDPPTRSSYSHGPTISVPGYTPGWFGEISAMPGTFPGSLRILFFVPDLNARQDTYR